MPRLPSFVVLSLLFAATGSAQERLSEPAAPGQRIGDLIVVPPTERGGALWTSAPTITSADLAARGAAFLGTAAVISGDATRAGASTLGVITFWRLGERAVYRCLDTPAIPDVKGSCATPQAGP